MKNIIQQRIQDSISLKTNVLANQELINNLEQLANLCVNAFNNGNKILWCGNGGSAADAQHLSAELSGRYYYDRPPLFSEALHVNTSYLTAVANDYSYDEIYSRLVKAMGNEGDILIGLSTSGNSKNVVKALETARSLNMKVIGFTGEGGGKMKPLCDICFDIPSKDTPRIQECHMLFGHILCELIETKLFPKP